MMNVVQRIHDLERRQLGLTHRMADAEQAVKVARQDSLDAIAAYGRLEARLLETQAELRRAMERILKLEENQ